MPPGRWHNNIPNVVWCSKSSEKFSLAHNLQKRILVEFLVDSFIVVLVLIAIVNS